MRTEIFEYISLINEWVYNAQDMFLKGNCVGFALMLKDRFPGGVILYNGNHAIYVINNIGYDITGEVEFNKEYLPIEGYGARMLTKILRPQYTI